MLLLQKMKRSTHLRSVERFSKWRSRNRLLAALSVTPFVDDAKYAYYVALTFFSLK